jgi:cation diffusion facilitator CzcD-associated flavoprotein CzcO
VTDQVEIAIVGAGFGGMYMLHRARQVGMKALVFERGSDVGGTWFWNRYPGARCDVPSLEYSYQFSDELQQEWEWSEKYATQPEILRYAQHVAERFDLKRDIRFRTSVVSMYFDEADDSWLVTPSHGQPIRAKFVVTAMGCLSSANRPHFADDNLFSGEVYHTGEWPTDGVNFAGMRVAVIGTGSSGVQAIPLIAHEAKHLTVFQRTPAYTIPAHHAPNTPEYTRSIKSNYAEFRAKNKMTRAALGGATPTGTRGAIEVTDEELNETLEARWAKGGLLFLGGFNDSMTNARSNERIAQWVRDKIASIVSDPKIAARLQPHTVIGCKRLVVDSGYYNTFNQDNVQLIDLDQTGIERFTENGLVANGVEHKVDVMVLATGFDAMTGSLLKVDIRGRGGRTLSDAWSAGPVNYLGLAVHGFPNLFTITGPGSPSVLTNLIVSIEHHVEWITRCLQQVVSSNVRNIETTQRAQDEWVAHVNAVANMTLFPSCNSWYLGANVPGKPRVFMPLPGFPDYVKRCSDVENDDYRGFELTG